MSLLIQPIQLGAFQAFDWLGLSPVCRTKALQSSINCWSSKTCCWASTTSSAKTWDSQAGVKRHLLRLEFGGNGGFGWLGYFSGRFWVKMFSYFLVFPGFIELLYPMAKLHSTATRTFSKAWPVASASCQASASAGAPVLQFSQGNSHRPGQIERPATGRESLEVLGWIRQLVGWFFRCFRFGVQRNLDWIDTNRWIKLGAT